MSTTLDAALPPDDIVAAMVRSSDTQVRRSEKELNQGVRDGMIMQGISDNVDVEGQIQRTGIEL